MKIFIIGLPGSGKSTLGRQLADSMQYPFFDLDRCIEAEEKTSVQEIFEKKASHTSGSPKRLCSEKYLKKKTRL